jgi:hypothetical protein
LNLPEVLVSFRKLAFAPFVFDEQARRAGDDADLGYRQITQKTSYGSQSSSQPGPGRKDQLEVVATTQRDLYWITTLTAEPRLRVLSHRE